VSLNEFAAFELYAIMTASSPAWLIRNIELVMLSFPGERGSVSCKHETYLVARQLLILTRTVYYMNSHFLMMLKSDEVKLKMHKVEGLERRKSF